MFKRRFGDSFGAKPKRSGAFSALSSRGSSVARTPVARKTTVINAVPAGGGSGDKESLEDEEAQPSTPEIAWTTIPLHDPNDRLIYVSNTDPNRVTGGAWDSAHGSITNPYETIAAALGQMRDNSGDRLYLKCGDTFSGVFAFAFSLRGLSALRPMIFGSYGSGPRPVIDQLGSSYGFHTSGAVTLTHTWFIGIKFRSSTYNGSFQAINIEMNGGFSDLLLEDCHFENTSFGLLTNGATVRYDLRMRGCVFNSIYRQGLGLGCDGFLVAKIFGVLVEYCSFARCGWDVTKSGSGPHFLNHSGYLQGHLVNGASPGCEGVVFRHNITLDTGGVGLRGGGTAENNFAARTSDFAVGGSQFCDAPGVQMIIHNNVTTEVAKNGLATSYGYTLTGIGLPSYITNNIISGLAPDAVPADDIRVLFFQSIINPGPVTRAAWLAKTYIKNNIFFRAGTFENHGDSVGYDANMLELTDNDFQVDKTTGGVISFNPGGIVTASVKPQYARGNNFFCTTAEGTGWGYADGSYRPIATLTGPTFLNDTTATFVDHTVPGAYYVDPNRTAATYYVNELGNPDLGTSTLNFDAFRDAINAQSRETWNKLLTAPYINNYIRAGFARV